MQVKPSTIPATVRPDIGERVSNPVGYAEKQAAVRSGELPPLLVLFDPGRQGQRHVSVHPVLEDGVCDRTCGEDETAS